MPRAQLSVDEAFIALIIAAMEADRHAVPEEAARAEQLVRTLPRFRKPGSAAVGRMIEDMKRFVHDHDDDIHAAGFKWRQNCCANARTSAQSV